MSCLTNQLVSLQRGGAFPNRNLLVISNPLPLGFKQGRRTTTHYRARDLLWKISSHITIGAAEQVKTQVGSWRTRERADMAHWGSETPRGNSWEVRGPWCLHCWPPGEGPGPRGHCCSAGSGAGWWAWCGAMDKLESASTTPSVTTFNHDDLHRSSHCFTSGF